MTTDARISAWLAAWDNLEAASKHFEIALAAKDIHSNMEAVAQFQRQAELYSVLAAAPHDVGSAAGLLIAEAKAAKTADFNAAINDFMGP